MSADFGKAFGMAFRYAASTKRMWPFFLLNLMMLASMMVFFTSLISIVPSITAGSLAFITAILSSIGLLIVVFAIFMLLNIFLDGAVADNSRLYYQNKDQPLSQSFNLAKKKYLSLLGASLLAGVIVVLLSLIPIVGFIIGIVFSWFFIFIAQLVVISNKSAVDSLKEGYNLFMKNKLDVFVFWLLLGIIGTLLFLIMLIPAVISVAPLVFAVFITKSVSLALIQSSLPLIAVGGIISAFLLSYVQVFQEGAKTFFYMQKKVK